MISHAAREAYVGICNGTHAVAHSGHIRGMHGILQWNACSTAHASNEATVDRMSWNAFRAHSCTHTMHKVDYEMHEVERMYFGNAVERWKAYGTRKAERLQWNACVGKQWKSHGHGNHVVERTHSNAVNGIT